MFAIGDAVFTQAHLARAFERTRIATDHSASLAQVNTPSISKLGHSMLPHSQAPSAHVSALGRLEIARLGISAMIVDGTDSPTLRVGVGHISGTPTLGEPGNVAIAGHRDTFFRPLRGIRSGDEVVLETVAGDFHYRVSSTEIVDPSDVDVLRSRGQNELTLVTCYPFSYIGRAPKRFIVHTVLSE
jgi:sortase A